MRKEGRERDDKGSNLIHTKRQVTIGVRKAGGGGRLTQTNQTGHSPTLSLSHTIDPTAATRSSTTYRL